jgi:hypothetical protein
MGKKSKSSKSKGGKYTPLDNDFEYDDKTGRESANTSTVEDQPIVGPAGQVNTISGIGNIGNTCYLNSCLQGR